MQLKQGGWAMFDLTHPPKEFADAVRKKGRFALLRVDEAEPGGLGALRDAIVERLAALKPNQFDRVAIAICPTWTFDGKPPTPDQIEAQLEAVWAIVREVCPGRDPDAGPWVLYGGNHDGCHQNEFLDMPGWHGAYFSSERFLDLLGVHEAILAAWAEE
jgi:triosephosphate isomerase